MCLSVFCQVTARENETERVLANMTLNATTMSVMLNSLTRGATYYIKVVAFTKIGDGPYSKPVSTSHYYNLL